MANEQQTPTKQGTAPQGAPEIEQSLRTGQSSVKSSGANRSGGASPSAPEAAKPVMRGAGEQLAEVKDQITEQVSEAGAQLKQTGIQMFDERKEQAVRKLCSLKDSVRQAAEQCKERDENNIAPLLEGAAQRMEKIEHQLRSKDFTTLFEDAQDLMRSRPELVYGGLFVAGLGLSRFLKASGRSKKNKHGTDYSVDRQGNMQRLQSGSPGMNAKAPEMVGPLNSQVEKGLQTPQGGINSNSLATSGGEKNYE